MAMLHKQPQAEVKNKRTAASNALASHVAEFIGFNSFWATCIHNSVNEEDSKVYWAWGAQDGAPHAAIQTLFGKCQVCTPSSLCFACVSGSFGQLVLVGMAASFDTQPDRIHLHACTGWGHNKLMAHHIRYHRWRANCPEPEPGQQFGLRATW